MTKKKSYKNLNDLVTDTSTQGLNSYVVELSAKHFDEHFKSLCLKDHSFTYRGMIKLHNQVFQRHNPLIIRYLIDYNTPKDEYKEVANQIEA